MVIFIECSKTSISHSTQETLANWIECSGHDIECRNHRKGEPSSLNGTFNVCSTISDALNIQYPLGREWIGAKKQDNTTKQTSKKPTSF